MELVLLLGDGVICWMMILDGASNAEAVIVLVVCEAWGMVQRRTMGCVDELAVVPTSGSRTCPAFRLIVIGAG